MVGRGQDVSDLVAPAEVVLVSLGLFNSQNLQNSGTLFWSLLNESRPDRLQGISAPRTSRNPAAGFR